MKKCWFQLLVLLLIFWLCQDPENLRRTLAGIARLTIWLYPKILVLLAFLSSIPSPILGGVLVTLLIAPVLWSLVRSSIDRS